MNENELVQVTVRLPRYTKDEIEELAKDKGVSIAEIIRLSIDNKLSKFLDEVQYIDQEQGKEIRRQQDKIFSVLDDIGIQLKRIGINYNQEIKLKNTEKLFGQGHIGMKELLNQTESIMKECQDFTPDKIDKIMDRYEELTREMREGIMCYTRITASKNGKASIAYCRGCGHNGHDKRNILIGAVGMVPDDIIPFEKQMEVDWARKASRNNLNQVRRIIASFSTKELDPNDIECAYTAMDIAKEFVKTAYPERKAAIFLQKDGVGGKLHAHILVSNVDSVKYKGCTSWQTGHDYVSQEFDKIASSYITLDYGKGAKEKYSQVERALREKNEEILDVGKEEFIWKDYLRERIRIAMNQAKSKDNFLDELAKMGISGRYGKSSKHGEYLTYEIVKFPEGVEAPSKAKVRSYLLGEDYGTEALETALSEKKIENIDFSKEQDKEIAEQMVRHEDFDASATTGKALIDEDYESVVSNEIEVKEDEEVLIKKPSFYQKMLYMKSQMDKEERERQYDRQYDGNYFRRY